MFIELHLTIQYNSHKVQQVMLDSAEESILQTMSLEDGQGLDIIQLTAETQMEMVMEHTLLVQSQL